MSNKILLILIFFSITNLYSQSISTEHLEKEQRIEKFLIITKTGDRVYGKAGVLNKDLFHGTKLNGEKISFERNSIKHLYSQVGSKAGIVGICGGLAGFLSTISIQISSNSGYQNNSASPTVILSATVIGSVIGAIIGNNHKNWVKIF